MCFSFIMPNPQNILYIYIYIYIKNEIIYTKPYESYIKTPVSERLYSAHPADSSATSSHINKLVCNLCALN